MIPYKFADAQSVEELGQMLDDFMFRFGQTLLAPAEVFTSIGQVPVTVPDQSSGIHAGSLVRVSASGSAEAADSSKDKPATHVVLKVYASNRAVAAPFAILPVSLTIGPVASPQYLYLRNAGSISTEPPSEGRHQIVGTRLYYDKAHNQHVCLFHPAFDLGTLL